MLSSDSRKPQGKEDDQPRKLAPIVSQAAAWAPPEQQGLGSTDQDLPGYMRAASVDAARDLVRSSPIPRPPMIYSSSAPNMRDYRMMAAPYPGYPATSGAMPGYPPDRRYYETGQVPFKYPGMPSPLHPKSASGMPFPPGMRSGHPGPYPQPPQSPQILPNGTPSPSSTGNRFPYGSQMLVPPSFPMSAPMAKSIAPSAVTTPPTASTAGAASASAGTDNGSAAEQAKTSEPQAQPHQTPAAQQQQVQQQLQQQQQQQPQLARRPSPDAGTPIAARPTSAGGAATTATSTAAAVAATSASTTGQTQAQQPQQAQPLQPQQQNESKSAAAEASKYGDNSTASATAAASAPQNPQLFDEFVPVMILRPLGMQFTPDDVMVGRVMAPPQRIVQDYLSYPIHYETERPEPEAIMAAKEAAIAELRKHLLAQLNTGPAYFANPMLAGGAKAMYAMPPPGMYPPMAAYGRMPGQPPMAPPGPGKSIALDGDLSYDGNDAAGRPAIGPGRSRPRIWPGQTHYPKHEYRPLPSEHAPEQHEVEEKVEDATIQKEKKEEGSSGISIPHKKRTLSQSIRDWKRFAKDTSNGGAGFPTLDTVVELLGCGSVSTTIVDVGSVDDVQDIKRLTASLEKKFARKLQADDDAEAEAEQHAVDRGRSTRSSRGGRRDRASDADADDTEKAREEQDNSDLWVQCDKCSTWRRLPPKSDPHHPKSLPARWYCRMNTWDPARADCSVPQEQYNAHPNARPPSDRARKIRVLVRRLKAMDRFEARPSNRSQFCVDRERYYGDVDWIRCSNPTCGKWRAMLRSIDGQALRDKYPVWFCWMNSWDDARASCGAPQDNSHLRSYAEPVVIEDDQSEEQETPEPRPDDDYLDNSQIQGISSKGRIVRSRWNTRRRGR